MESLLREHRLRHLSHLNGVTGGERDLIGRLIAAHLKGTIKLADPQIVAHLWARHGYPIEVESVVIQAEDLARTLLQDYRSPACLVQTLSQQTGLNIQLFYGEIYHQSRQLVALDSPWFEFTFQGWRFRGDFWLQKALGLDGGFHRWIPWGIHTAAIFADWHYEKTKQVV